MRNGFDEATIQQIKNQIRAAEKPKVNIRAQARQRYEIWQQYYENGEYLRFAESVINKLHKKQIEIAIRSGKLVPKYLKQNRELNRR